MGEIEDIELTGEDLGLGVSSATKSPVTGVEVPLPSVGAGNGSISDDGTVTDGTDRTSVVGTPDSSTTGGTGGTAPANPSDGSETVPEAVPVTTSVTYDEVITDYSAASLAAYQAAGAVAIAVYSDGTEEQVPWSAVSEPQLGSTETMDLSPVVEAALVSVADGQHFFDDSNGAHVTDCPREDWDAAVEDSFSDATDAKPYHNLLMNSLGILLRSALNNLVSITRSAISFFDGLGNTAANVIASFGREGARIGYSSKAHATISDRSMTLTDGSTDFFKAQMVNTGENESVQVTETLIADNTYSNYGNVTHRCVMLSFSVNSDADIISVELPDVTGTVTYHARTAGYQYQLLLLVDGATTLIPAGTVVKVTYRTSQPVTLAQFGTGAATGAGSISLGSKTAASGTASTAMGVSSRAEGDRSLAVGFESWAYGVNSLAFGHYSYAAGANQTVLGRGNLIDMDDKYALIVGNGLQPYRFASYSALESSTSRDLGRSNALSLDWDGNLAIAGGMSAIAPGVSYIYGPAGRSAFSAKRESGSTAFCSALSIDTPAGGGWSIGTYSTEALRLVYGTASNVSSETNTVSQIVFNPAETANRVLVSPNGSAGMPSFRALVANDLPHSAVTQDPDEISTSGNYPVINPASGTTLVYCNARQSGGVVSLAINFTLSAAVSVPASGDIGNFTVGTLVSAWRPKVSMPLTSIGDGAGFFTGVVNTNGTVVVRQFSGSSGTRTVSAGTTFYLRAVYPIL